MGFGAPLPARRTLDFAFFGVVRSAAVLRAGLALAWPRFELFLRVATRFFAMSPVTYATGRPISKQANYTDIISQRFATPLLFHISRMMPSAINLMILAEGRTSTSYYRHVSLASFV
jgi:hypothetical protein